tara:strand:+ start:12062 stop:12613 length:552 start_codon:yes stop_codon:yes gene_type:complete
MKKLQIELTIGTANEKPSIYLGNVEWLHGKSKKFLAKYLVTYKKVLLDNVKAINILSIQVNALYRTFYFEFSSIEVYRISEYFEDFNKQFDNIFHSTYENENSFVLRRVERSASVLYDILDSMRLHGQKHKNYQLKNQCDATLKLLSILESTWQEDKRSLKLDRKYLASDHLRVLKPKNNKAV